MRASTSADNVDFVGAEIAFGATLLGHVLAVVRDPLSHRVRRLITSYGANGRRVAVPMEWVVRRTPTRLTLGVGTLSLNDLPEQTDVWRGGAIQASLT